MIKFLKKNNLWIAWLISLIATSGSLYFSEIKGFMPCQWCWYARILMYPMVWLLGLAAFKKDLNIIRYVNPLIILGIILNTTHYLEQKIGLFSKITGGTCSSYLPCSGIYIELFGFVTIPFMSLTAFTLMFLILNINKKAS